MSENSKSEKKIVKGLQENSQTVAPLHVPTPRPKRPVGEPSTQGISNSDEKK